MNLKGEYINPLTVFGFKKLFRVESNKELLIDFLNQLLPPVHQIKELSYTKNEHLGNTQQERVFEKLFEVAEIARFTPSEKELYEESLKYYRDLKNVVDTSKAEGIQIGMEKGIEEGIEKGMKKGEKQKSIKVAKEMKADGVSVSKIAQYTGLSQDEIEKL